LKIREIPEKDRQMKLLCSIIILSPEIVSPEIARKLDPKTKEPVGEKMDQMKAKTISKEPVLDPQEMARLVKLKAESFAGRSRPVRVRTEK
jgi:hypothetical protein